MTVVGALCSSRKADFVAIEQQQLLVLARETVAGLAQIELQLLHLVLVPTLFLIALFLHRRPVVLERFLLFGKRWGERGLTNDERRLVGLVALPVEVVLVHDARCDRLVLLTEVEK